MPPWLALEIAESESKYRPHTYRVERNRTLSVGVFGLNQVLWHTVGVDDPWDWRLNVIGGVGCLSRLVKKYGGDEAKLVRVEKCVIAWGGEQGMSVKIEKIMESWLQEIAKEAGTYKANGSYAHASTLIAIEKARKAERRLALLVQELLVFDANDARVGWDYRGRKHEPLQYPTVLGN